VNCPTDSTTLMMSERSGIEIDYCPECRGVWLDRGELDKIIERAEKEFTAAPAQVPTTPVATAFPQPQRSPRYDDRDDRGDRGYNDRDRGRDSDRDRDKRDGYRPKKRENWLGELFG